VEKDKTRIPIAAIFFDLGDTIVDLREGQADYQERLSARMGKIYDLLHAAGTRLPERPAFCLALSEYSETSYQAAVAAQRGLSIRTVLVEFFRERGIEAGDGLLAASVDAYCGMGSVESLAPLRKGAGELLAGLHAAGLRLGVISNTLQPGQHMDRALARRGLLEYFSTRTYSSDEGVAKPHPTIFRAALSAIGVPPPRALHVGDRLLADVAGAQSVGMRAVLIRVPQRPETNQSIVPDACIDELSDLPNVLTTLAG
jgi:putative hydrolase of the HAD superfamily